MALLVAMKPGAWLASTSSRSPWVTRKTAGSQLPAPVVTQLKRTLAASEVTLVMPSRRVVSEKPQLVPSPAQADTEFAAMSYLYIEWSFQKLLLPIISQ